MLIFQGPRLCVHEAKQRWQDACVDEQLTPDKTQTQKGSKQ